MRGPLHSQLLASRLVSCSKQRHFHVFSRFQQQYQPPAQQQRHASPSPHGNFYKSHGRALFKALTLAFFSYQCFYWAWVTLETEELKDGKTQEIKSLEGEVRLLEEGRNSHRPRSQGTKVVQDGDRLLEEGKS